MKADLELEQDIYKAAEEVCYRELKDIECAIAEEGEHDFSKEYRKKIERTIYKRKITEGSGFLHEGQKGRKIKYRYFLLVAILLILSTSTVLAMEPVREKLSHVFYTVFQDNVEIRECDSGEEIETMPEKSVVVKKPIYIPEGYELLEEELDEDTQDVTIIWENEQTSYLVYSQLSMDGASMSITSDGSIPEKVDVNGKDARIIWDKTDDMGTLFYEEKNYIYMISGVVSKEELIKILESIE